MDSEIRTFQEDDLEALAALYLRAHIDEYSGEKSTFVPEGLQESPALLKLFRQSNIYVFKHDEIIKGFVGSKEQRIIWLYVDPDYRGQGIGRKMIDLCWDS